MMTKSIYFQLCACFPFFKCEPVRKAAVANKICSRTKDFTNNYPSKENTVEIYIYIY